MTAHATGSLTIVDRQQGPTWYGRVRTPDGRQLNRSLGLVWRGRSNRNIPPGYLSERMAHRALDELMGDAEAYPPTISTTFGRAAHEWLRYLQFARRPRLSPSTLAGYQRYVNGRLVPQLGADTPLWKIDTARIERLRDDLVRQDLSDATISQALVILGAMLGHCVETAYLRENPAKGVKRPTPTADSDEKTILDFDQIEQVAAAATPQDAALILTAGFCGLREGELRALRWRHVAWTDRLIHVERNRPAGGDGTEKAPKSGKGRGVPLPDEVGAALERLSHREHFTGPDDLVFVSPTGAPVDDKLVRLGFYAALEAAGLGHLREGGHGRRAMTFHMLRDSFCTNMLSAGFDIRRVQAWAGHADIKTTVRYLKFVPQHDAVDQLRGHRERARASARVISVSHDDAARGTAEPESGLVTRVPPAGLEPAT